MSTSPDPTTERGGPLRWLVALGLVLAALLVTLPWTARALVERAVGRRPARSPYPSRGSRSRPSAAEPYEVAPDVEIARPHATATAGPGVPVRLLVPSLQVDAPVVPISAPGGVLLPPDDPQTLGWWSAGAQPGAATGGALITGHTVHTGGGAFDDLETLDPGDVVRVRTRRGCWSTPSPTSTVYRKSTLARDAERIFSQTVPGRLVLITCEDWNGTGYDSNAVVVAERL